MDSKEADINKKRDEALSRALSTPPKPKRESEKSKDDKLKKEKPAK